MRRIFILIITFLIIFVNCFDQNKFDINGYELYEPVYKEPTEEIDTYVEKMIGNLTEKQKIDICKAEKIKSEEDLHEFLKETTYYREYYAELIYMDKEHLEILKKEFKVDTNRDLFRLLKNQLRKLNKEFNIVNFKDLIYCYTKDNQDK